MFFSFSFSSSSFSSSSSPSSSSSSSSFSSSQTRGSPPRRAHVMFHHLISGEMLDGCVRPLAILHSSVFSTYSALWCSVVSGTIRTVVVSVTVMGSWEPGLSRSPPKPTDSSAWTRTKQEGNQRTFDEKSSWLLANRHKRSKYDGVLSK